MAKIQIYIESHLLRHQLQPITEVNLFVISSPEFSILRMTFPAEASHHPMHQRYFSFNLSWSFAEGGFSLFFGINREINREFFVF